jgi:dTDP-4-dehydrorhamnose reductase
MKILITGAGGMLGSDLVARLRPSHSLTGVGRHPAPHLEIPFHGIDLTQRRETTDLIEREKPEIVLHAAAMTDVDGCEAHRHEAVLSNFEATRHVVEASNHVGALVIFFSTDFVFNGKKAEPYLESDVPEPINVYGETKLLAERYLLLRGNRFLILRSSWLFGKHGNNFPKKVLKQAEEGKTLSVVSDQLGNPTYTVDLAKGTEEIIQILTQSTPSKSRRINQIYHIANEGVASRFEIACFVLKKKGHSVDRVKPIRSESLHYPVARPRYSALSTEKLRKTFEIRLRSWEEALEAYLGEDPAITKPSLLTGKS